MIYLLDADTVIRADNRFFTRKRSASFWLWLPYQGAAGHVKIPREQFDEIVAGNGDLVDWLKTEEVKDALLLESEVDAALVSKVLDEGYAPDLNEAQLIEVGKDPFLIAHAASAPGARTVVSFETSAPARLRQNRKIPDVCAQFGVPCVDLFAMVDALDYTEDWQPLAG
jgi:hypothetical protein